MSKYTVTQSAVTQLLADVKSEKIAIPELQRPFVWDSVKVRDLMDSLYNGYPVGYLITWHSIGAHLKGGQVAAHQQILIDGQQRITALRAAVAGLPIVTKRYQQKRISIAFNPLTEEFATTTPFHRKDPEWISDISDFFNSSSPLGFARKYREANPEADEDVFERNLEKLAAIKSSQIGIIALADDLDVETVSEIFVRINSKGVPLSSADFAMSKIATYGDRGRNLRKLIDYFCHLAIAPHAIADIRDNDHEFASSKYFSQIEWLKDDNQDIYDPEYNDVIRVAGLVGFQRGKIASVVAELSGRDPETRTTDESRIEPAFDKLEWALERIVRKYMFEKFVMLVKSLGFVRSNMINGTNALNFAYALYILLSDQHMNPGERDRIVKRWLVLSMLTGRYSGSVESVWELDARRIAELGAPAYLEQLEAYLLSDTFWTATLPQNLRTTSSSSPYFKVFLAAQVSWNAHGFLSKNIDVRAILEHSGDIHHVVPKAYLIKNGFDGRADANQVANYALTETAINIAISDAPPAEYMARINAQCSDGVLSLGEIMDPDQLAANLEENAIPANFADFEIRDYEEFLEARRELMAAYIRRYYEGL